MGRKGAAVGGRLPQLPLDQLPKSSNSRTVDRSVERVEADPAMEEPEVSTQEWPP